MERAKHFGQLGDRETRLGSGGEVRQSEIHRIRAGFAKLKDGRAYDALADAARGRSRADWLVGMNLSRAYGLSLGKPLSVGRVQTPTLAMIVERFLSVRVHYIGCIERDGHVSRSVLMQQPFTVAYPNSTATRRLNILAGTLLAQAEEAKPQGGFFSRLVQQIFRASRS